MTPGDHHRTPRGTESTPSKVSRSDSSHSAPKQSIIHIVGPNLCPKRKKFLGQDPVGPHHTPKRTETPSDLSTFLLECFTQLKSAYSGPKFAKQSILCIIGPKYSHLRQNGPSSNPQIFYPSKVLHSLSQVIVTQNMPNNPSSVLLGLIQGRLPNPDPRGPPSDLNKTPLKAS